MDRGAKSIPCPRFGSEGGATLSGGEPLFQEQFCYEIQSELKSMGIHTVLDTSGSVYSERCLSLADLVILDIKRNNSYDFFSLCEYTMDNTLKTLSFLQRREKKFWVHQAIKPGINDNEKSIKELVNMTKGAEHIQLLGYHTMGVEKYDKLKMEYRLKDMPPMDLAKLKKLQKYCDECCNVKELVLT